MTFREVMQELCEEIQRLDGSAWGEIPVDQALDSIRKFTKQRSEWEVIPITRIEFEKT